MKKKHIAVILGLALAVSMTACGTAKTKENHERERDTNNRPESEVSIEIDETTADTTTADDSQVVDYDSYINNLTMIANQNYQVSVGYKDNSGIYPIVNSGDGTIAYTYLGDNKLITFDLDSSNNELNISSIKQTSADSYTAESSVALKDFIIISDTSKVLFSKVELPDGDEGLMIEARSTAYTFSDGVDYHMYIVELDDNGELNLVLDTWTCGSGDEDITSKIRNDFNDAMGTDYDQDYFEDIFYSGNMYSEKENLPVFAMITFKSYTSDWADEGDWERSSKLVESIYGNTDEITEWGVGEFKTF